MTDTLGTALPREMARVRDEQVEGSLLSEAESLFELVTHLLSGPTKPSRELESAWLDLMWRWRDKYSEWTKGVWEP